MVLTPAQWKENKARRFAQRFGKLPEHRKILARDVVKKPSGVTKTQPFIAEQLPTLGLIPLLKEIDKEVELFKEIRRKTKPRRIVKMGRV